MTNINDYLDRIEFAEDFAAFEDWASSRIWCADFDAAGLPHVEDNVTTGYAYAYGCWIEDRGTSAGGHRYYTEVCRDYLTSDNLSDVERFLWNNHAKYEAAAS